MPIRKLQILVVLLHAYVALRLLPALANLTSAWLLLALLLLGSAVVMPMPFRRWSRVAPTVPAAAALQAAQASHAAQTEPMIDVRQWAGLIAIGWFSTLFVLTVLRDAGLLLTWIERVVGVALPEWPRGSSWSAAGVAIVACVVTLIGFVNARRTAAVRRVDVPLARLPTALEGFTMVQISDLHVGPTIRRRYIERIVAAVNALNADVIAITGDLADGSVAELREHVAPLAELRARHGSFVVTGNHEYYAGAAAWITELRRLGLHVLLNEHVVLDHSMAGPAGAQLVLAGVTDFSAGQFDRAQASDPARALTGAPATVATRVLLAHQPRSAPAAAAAGFQLQLSGHTHGGQFFPWNLLVPMQQPFTAGLHRLAGLWVYVSRGTGYWGPPKRFGAPSEITLLRLVRADDR